MSGDVDHRIDELFHASLEQPPEQRGELLANACGGDVALRREVESLLAAHAALDGFLQVPAHSASGSDATAVCETASTDPVALIGRRIGQYRVTDVIAVGGMGTVYRAVRADDSYEHQAAVKLIRRGMMSEALRRRFHLERQTLANLQHPYITRLIDGGSTADGLPFLVMEYVDGKPIDVYCDEHRLNVRDRIRLFRLVCEAVHFAHQNLIVHRDLKPSNTLVTADGQPRLLDFGIAKLLSGGDGAGTVDATETLFRVLTPRYASPEQVRGEPVTTASDVYSLGVLLYELLTGHRPYRLEHSSSYENERIICEQDPPTPSLMVSRAEDIVVPDGTTGEVTPDLVGKLRSERLAQLRRHLKGDLDNIVLMAMQKDPRRRYASVQQLSEDLQRYLDGMPVIAQKDTLAYRAVKLAKRNKAVVTVSAALALALLVGILGTTIGLVRTQRAQVQAQQERNLALTAQEEAQSVAAFLQEILAAANPYRTGRDASVVLELLDDASARVQAEYAGRPATEAAVRYAIANTYAGLWHWPAAEPHLRRALELNRRLHGSTHPAVADCLILLGRALTFGRNVEAIAVQREALAIRRQLFEEDSPEVAWSKTCLAFALWHWTDDPSGMQASQLAEAELLAFEALDVQRPLREINPLELAISLHTVGAMFRARGDNERAAAVFHEALEVYRALPDQEDRYLAECVRAHAQTLGMLGRYEEEERMLREYVERTPHAFLAYPAPRLALWRLGGLTRRRAGAAADAEAAKLFVESAEYYERAMDAELVAWNESQSETEKQFKAAGPLPSCGGDPIQLASSAERLLAVLDAHPSEGAAYFVERLAGPGELLMDMGHRQRAAEYFERLQASMRDDPYGRRAAYVQGLLGVCRLSLGQYDVAEPLLRRSFATYRAGDGEDRASLRTAAERLVRLYEQWGRPELAGCYRNALEDKTARQ